MSQKKIYPACRSEARIPICRGRRYRSSVPVAPEDGTGVECRAYLSAGRVADSTGICPVDSRELSKGEVDLWNT